MIDDDCRQAVRGVPIRFSRIENTRGGGIPHSGGFSHRYMGRSLREFSYRVHCPSVNVSLFTTIFFFIVIIISTSYVGVVSSFSAQRVCRARDFSLNFVFHFRPKRFVLFTMADKEKDNDDVEATIADEAVVTKYKTAGEIANRKCNGLSQPVGSRSAETRLDRGTGFRSHLGHESFVPGVRDMSPERLVPATARFRLDLT